jgi:hypothetical protein
MMYFPFVPKYAEVRTFAVERIKNVSVQEATFEPIAELDADPFRDSMGVHRGGATCKVRLRFHPQIAAFVKEAPGTPRNSSKMARTDPPSWRWMLPTTMR